MKVIICGSRTVSDIADVETAIYDCGFDIDVVLSGAARGVDAMGEAWAKKNAIPYQQFVAKWNEHGRAAGPMRNSVMAEHADACIAVWDGKSRGTFDMMKKAHDQGLPVYVRMVRP